MLIYNIHLTILVPKMLKYNIIANKVILSYTCNPHIQSTSGMSRYFQPTRHHFNVVSIHSPIQLSI